MIDAVRPIVGGGQRGRCGSRAAAVDGEPVRDDVEQQPFHHRRQVHLAIRQQRDVITALAGGR
ncbi:MAG: hypothetical protein ACRDS1_16080 [Pseudonocardiaceae bacterium]